MPESWDEQIRQRRLEHDQRVDRFLAFGPAHDAPPPPARLTDVPTEPGHYLVGGEPVNVCYVESKGGLCTYEEDRSGPGSWSGWFRIDDPNGPRADRKWGPRVVGVRYVTEEWRDD